MREMQQKSYTLGADYIIHHSQSIVANMSFILLKLPLPSQGPLCTLTNTSQHTQTYCILSLYSLCTVSGVYHRPPGTLLCEERSWCRGILYSIDGAVFLLGSENKVSLMHSGV